MDSADHDLVGSNHHPDWFRLDDGTVLRRPFFPRTCRSQLFPGNDCLFDALVLRA